MDIHEIGAIVIIIFIVIAWIVALTMMRPK